MGNDAYKKPRSFGVIKALAGVGAFFEGIVLMVSAIKEHVQREENWVQTAKDTSTALPKAWPLL